MAGAPPPYPSPGNQDWKYQRRVLRDQARAQRQQLRYQTRMMRRRSIIGPLLILLIGVLALLVQTGLLPSDHVWMWYARWWPLLLVLVGVILLAEWGVDQVRPRDPQQPYFRRTIGGGAIVLIVLLVLAGMALHGIRNGHTFLARSFAINSNNFEEFFGSKHESDENRIEAFPSGSVLTIDNPRGDVTVTGISDDHQVHIAVHKQIYSHSDSDAESKARELTPRIAHSGNLVSVALPSMDGALADLTITVPSDTRVTVAANHGDVHLDSISAPVTITANHGDVELSSIAGAVTARINNSGSSLSAHNITGPLSVEGRGQDLTLSEINGAVSLAGDFYGTTHLEHITGAIKFHTSRTNVELARLDGDMEISPDADLSVDQALGPLMLTTRNRNIDLQRISGDLSVTNRNGSVELTSAPPLGNVTVQNRNGSVTLTLPNKANFAVNAETSDGDLENDFSLPAQESDNRKTLNGTVGKGGSLIRINTTQGDVAIRKASIAPLSSTPPATPTPPHLDLKSQDGSSVYVGKDGVRIVSGDDGSSIIIGKDGLQITSRPDGSSIYKGKDGTLLSENTDGSKVLVTPDGSRYTIHADGSRLYKGHDETSITVDTDGTQTATGPGGKSLSSSEIRNRLQGVEDRLRHAEQQLDAERNSHRKDRP